MPAPAARSARRWCPTRFSALPVIHARSQTHSSPPSRKASVISSRVGSASAFARDAAFARELGSQTVADRLRAGQVKAQQIAPIIGHTVRLTHVEMRGGEETPFLRRLDRKSLVWLNLGLMVAESISPHVQDYAKAVYALEARRGAAVSTTDLAERLGVTPGSVSGMVRKLSELGLVEHEPYHGVG